MVFRAPGLWEHVRHGRAVQYWTVNPHAPGMASSSGLIARKASRRVSVSAGSNSAIMRRIAAPGPGWRAWWTTVTLKIPLPRVAANGLRLTPARCSARASSLARQAASSDQNEPISSLPSTGSVKIAMPV